MSHLVPGDQDLHYSDSSHRWGCPYLYATDEQQEAWHDRITAHVDAHQAAYDGPPTIRSKRDAR
jgi:hypothetical protein